MRVYLSGPMTGLPNYNYDAFKEAATRWRNVGVIVSNPAQNFSGDQSLPYSTYMKQAALDVLACDAIAMLPGWRNSHGARFELLIAQKIGLEVFNAVTMMPFDPPKLVVEIETSYYPLMLSGAGGVH